MRQAGELRYKEKMASYAENPVYLHRTPVLFDDVVMKLPSFTVKHLIKVS